MVVQLTGVPNIDFKGLVWFFSLNNNLPRGIKARSAAARERLTGPTVWRF